MSPGSDRSRRTSAVQQAFQAEHCSGREVGPDELVIGGDVFVIVEREAPEVADVETAHEQIVKAAPLDLSERRLAELFLPRANELDLVGRPGRAWIPAQCVGERLAEQGQTMAGGAFRSAPISSGLPVTRASALICRSRSSSGDTAACSVAIRSGVVPRSTLASSRCRVG